MNVKKEKIYRDLLSWHINEFIFNDGYYYANCEWDKENSKCYYIDKGCTDCKIARFHGNVLNE
jgi:hypothetical protein